MRRLVVGLLLAAIVALAGYLYVKKSTRQQDAQVSLVERGRYMVKIAGCNDCHTPGYMQNNGNVPEKSWLTGDALGWQGPWGTTYAVNLRLYFQSLTEEQWVQVAPRLQSRPPMPFYVFKDMSEEDLRAIYRFTRFLGPAGQPALAYLPPGVEATTPVFRFVPPPS